MKKLTFLSFYKASLKNPYGRMVDPRGKLTFVSGMCDLFDHVLPDPYLEDRVHEVFKLLKPTEQDQVKLGEANKSQNFWGSGLSKDDPAQYYIFTPLRQTLTLLGAAINNEL